MTMRHRSIRAFLVCLTPIVLWALCFFLVYGAETLACIPAAAAQGAALWAVPVVASVAIAAGALVFAARRLRLKGDGDGTQNFLARTSIELAGLAALATIWIVLALATISPCLVPS